jgi:hypothetical protein
MTVAEIVRRSPSAETMKKKIGLEVLVLFGLVSPLFGQESPTPTATPEQSASPTVTASASATSRSVPLRFVPPPMEGTISLGIFDSNGKLVRVLQREAKIDSFQIEENSLGATWDGKNDTGEDMPAGKYRARGFLVGKIRVEDLGKAESAPDEFTDHISVKLTVNPLTSDTRATMEIAISSDSKGTFLRTSDGLPLASLTEATNVSRISIQKTGDKTADVWQDDGSNIEHLRVSNIDKIMAFDCGFFELK